MITRRHIRIKVMQSVYAMQKSDNKDIAKQRRFLKCSIDAVFDMYVLNLQLMVATQRWMVKMMAVAKKKHLATQADLQPNTRFIANELLRAIVSSQAIQAYIEAKGLHHWDLNKEYVKVIAKALQESSLYKDYIAVKGNTFAEDKAFVVRFFAEIIAPNEKLMGYYEDQQMTWVADIPFVNTLIVKKLEKQKPHSVFTLEQLYKDADDEKFAVTLFEKTVLHQHKYRTDIQHNAQNWEVDRIATIDMILIQMAITEFLYFPSIPSKVTINEYIELAKNYSTEKSSYFINGILDKLAKAYLESKRMVKVGRGLL